MKLYFTLDAGVVVIWDKALDPFYADMAEGESFTTTDDHVEITLPYDKIPKPTAPRNVITRWKYGHAVVDGRQGWRVTKLPSHVTG